MKGDGTGSFSIYGDKFPVRPFADQMTYLLNIRRMRTSKKSTRVPAYYPWSAEVFILMLLALTFRYPRRQIRVPTRMAAR